MTDIIKPQNTMFSIIVPVYNTQDYLTQCLDSLVRQTYKDYEIILVNDGSKDKSLQICKKYEKDYPYISVIDKKNGGAVSAREAGLAAAKGEYVGFIDSDDWVDPELLDHCMQVKKIYNPDIISFNVFLEFSGKQERQKVTVESGFYDKEALKEKIYPVMLYNQYVNFYNFGIDPSLANKFFKRELAERNKCKDYRITMGDDAACVYASLLEADSLYMMKEYYYHYRQNQHSMTNTYDDKRFQRYQYLIEYMRKVLSTKKYNMGNQLKAHKAFCVKHAILNESRAPLPFMKKRKNLADKMKQYHFEDAFDDLKNVKSGPASKVFIFLVKHRCYGSLLAMCAIFKLVHKF